MEQNHESKSFLSQKQSQYSLEAINLGQFSLSQESLSHNSHYNISEAIFPFSITNTTKSFPNPDNFSSSPSHIDDSTANEGRDQSQTNESSGILLNNERRLKRMISNRESARRSRMRRKMQIEELQYLVSQLQTTNRQLSEKLIQLLDCNQQILQENSQLKEKVSSLQIVLADFLVPLKNVGEEHNSSGTDDRVLRAQEILLHHRCLESGRTITGLPTVECLKWLQSVKLLASFAGPIL